MSEERTPVYRCRQINPTNIALLEEGEETIRDEVKLAIQSGVLQVYSIYRYDNQTTTFAAYHPTKHALILFYQGETITASDIPSMYLGLKWWTQEPEIWLQHVVRGEQ